MKKGILGDKCGSCNQYIMDKENNLYSNKHTNNNNNNNVNTNQNIFQTPINYNSIKNNKSSEFNQLRNIQDSSNKYGSGSYSRILNNVGTVNVMEELRPMRTPTVRQHININTNLPTLSKGEIPKSVSKVINSKNDKTDKIDNNILSESSLIKDVMENKMLNGNQLIMKANKEFERKSKEGELKRRNSSGNN